MDKVTIPIEGANVRQGVNYTRGADGKIMPAGGQTSQTTPAPPLPDSQAGQMQGQAVETQQPAPPLTPLQQFHPSLDPSKVTMTFDEKTGKVRVIPIAEAEAAAVEAEGETEDVGDLPDLGEQHYNIPGGTQDTAQTATATAPTAEAQALRDQVGQLTQIVTAMAQAQLSGKPLAEMFGAQPAQPAEPDFSELDLYDPAQLAGFIKQSVGAAIQGAIAPHQQTIEGARRRQEYDATALKFGNEPDFRQKSIAAIQLVADNPALTIEQAYGVVNRIAQTLTPQLTAAAIPQPAATQATRTLTAEQAQQKADQAKRLPGNGGVRGAGKPEMPAHIQGLGQMIAWNLQQASQGN